MSRGIKERNHLTASVSATGNSKGGLWVWPLSHLAALINLVTCGKNFNEKEYQSERESDDSLPTRRRDILRGEKPTMQKHHDDKYASICSTVTSRTSQVNRAINYPSHLILNYLLQGWRTLIIPYLSYTFMIKRIMHAYDEINVSTAHHLQIILRSISFGSTIKFIKVTTMRYYRAQIERRWKINL